ncbi:LCP family protein required for cell wall assembly [Paenibacillus endophyticus]|uniref:LCP family protein required for cell wall assembly n=1 Tax=Paenibacillus endophyticus TaxID=1294268 RepID=A0A7W5GC76_9BACL|nr:LCP family protein [Paenibacillus endophyticus]MBB3153732.1 LCP family protein required for cell wall assembly [Paenibacillus endophyticus]
MSNETNEVPKEKNKSKKKKWKWFYISLSVILGAAAAFLIYWSVGVYGALDDFSDPKETKAPLEEAEATPVPVPEWEGKERVNILLLGGDARGVEEGQVARSDSILVASFDPVTKKAHLFSVLRDTYVDIEGHGKGRINTALALGEYPLAMKTVGDLLGLEIQYYVYTDFEGFKQLIDTIGGIYFDVEKDMHYTDNADGNRYDIDLKKGYQLLDGDKALQYVRFRHDAMSDFTRTERQRNFLQAVSKELQSTWNIVRMKKILESVQPYVSMNISVMDMLKLGQLGVKSHVASTTQIPPMELIAEDRVGGASVIGISDEDELRSYVQMTLEQDDTVPTPTDSSSPTDGAEETNQSQ